MDEQRGTSGPNFFNSKNSEKKVSPGEKRWFWVVFIAFLAFIFLIAIYVAVPLYDDWQDRPDL
ncbi:MAG: hypothetical protein KJI72_01385 [Patescibacteria group bacterium]|nr:hypothetical protein [Patescibacteria group bacterium]